MTPKQDAARRFGTEGDGEFPVSFGRYELLERIATGGMAEVFLARSVGVAGFEKRLVIKRIRAEHASDPRFVSMFINEARISVHLSHPNVVQVHDLNKVGPTWYIAMEHLHGRDLNRLVKALRSLETRLPVEVAVSILADACRGLAYAHGRTDASGRPLGLVHRDVSPHNVIVTFDGEVKLVDFGIARLMNTTAAPVPTGEPGRPGGGKYAYMSPEQASGHAVDHRTDVYSAAIVLWELICGRRLFQDPDPAEKLRKVREAVIPHPSEAGAIEGPGGVDDELWGILQRALSRDREQRTPSAAILEEDLRAWLYRAGRHVGRAEIAAAMRRAFPGEADPPAVDVDLRRMVDDVDQLDPASSERTGTSSHTQGSMTPTDGLPGRLRNAPGERKQVVAMVVDVDGLTDLSARVEPEVLFRHHYQLLKWLRRIVGRYGGTVQRAIDDQMLVLFGIPRTRDDDVERALDCAHELFRRSPEIDAKGFHVDLAVGIHQGDVTVAANMGRGRVRYEARGNTTRMARRLSAIADHHTVLVSDRIVAAASSAFRFKRGPEAANRGGKAPDPSWVAEGRKRGLRTSGRGTWVRRGLELDTIRDALVAVGANEGRTLIIHGKEGAGKSRLVREIRDLAVRRGIPIHVGRATPGEQEPVEVVGDFVRDTLGLDEPVSPKEAHGPLAELGVVRPDAEVLALAAARRAIPVDDDASWSALSRMIGLLARDGAAIAVLEDLHHLPPHAAARIARLAMALADRPVLLLLSVRGTSTEKPADRLSPADLVGVGQLVELPPLGTAAVRRLVKGALDVDEVDDGLVGLVERTCEGNALYVEELVKELVERGRVAVADRRAMFVEGDNGMVVPGSLAGLLAARIDRLDGAAKGLVQLAAVIGPTFGSGLLAKAAGVDDIAPTIGDLAGHGLIVRGHLTGDAWSFASDLLREVILRGILGVQRRDYHRLVAEAWELQPPSLDRDEALVTHYLAAGRNVDAARYAHKAGLQHEKQHALERARALYMVGLDAVRAIPELPETWDARVQGEATLALRLGTVAILLGEQKHGDRLLQLALDVAAEAGLPWIEVRAHLELGRSHLHRGRYDLAEAHLEQARERLDGESDPELAVDALEASATLAHERGRNAEAESLWNEAMSRAAGDRNATARCLLGLANRRLRAGDWVRAAPLLEQALQTARALGDRILEGRVLNNIGLVHAGAERFDEALSSFRAALEVREGIGYTRGVLVNHHNVGDVHFARGDLARAHVAFSRSRELAAEIGWERGIVLNEVYLGYIDAKAGDDAAIERTRKATTAAERLGDAETAIAGQWLVARWHQERGETAAAREQAEAGLKRAKRYDLQPMVEILEKLIATL